MSSPDAILSVAVNAETAQAFDRLSKFDRQLREVQGVARKGVAARLGASFDPAAFAAYEARLAQASRRAKDRQAFKAELGANFNNAAFLAYERSVEKARRDTQRLVAEQEAAGSRMRRAASSFFTGSQHPEGRSFARGTVRGAVGHGAGFLGGSLLGGVAGYLSAEGLKNSIESTTQLVKQSEILAHYTGMSAQNAMQFEAVSNALGVSAKGLGVGFRTLATAANTALVNPTKASLRAFGELGISMGDLQAHSKDLGGLFGLVADKLNKLPEGTARTAEAAKLLGRNWQQLAPLIMQGSRGMEEQLKQAKALGVVLGGDPVKNIAKLHEAEINLKLAQTGLSVQFTEHVAPALIKVTEGAIKLAATVRKDLTPVFRTLTPVVRDLGHWLERHKQIIEAVGAAYVGLRVIRTVGGWVIGLRADIMRAAAAGSTLIGSFRAQGAAASAETAKVTELTVAMERLAVAQRTAAAAGASGLILPAGVAAGAGAGVAGAAAKTGLLAGAAGLAKGAARFVAPIALFSGAASALTGGGSGGVAGVTRRFLSGATFGLIPGTHSTAVQQLEKQIVGADQKHLVAIASLTSKIQSVGAISGVQAAQIQREIQARAKLIGATASAASATSALASSLTGAAATSNLERVMRAAFNFHTGGSTTSHAVGNAISRGVAQAASAHHTAAHHAARHTVVSTQSAAQRAAERAQAAAQRAAERAAAKAAKQAQGIIDRSAGFQSAGGFGNTVQLPSQAVGVQIQLAEIANQIQVAQNRSNVPAEQSALHRQILVLRRAAGADQRKLAQINKMLRGHLTAAGRAARQQDKLALIQELGQLQSQIGSTLSSLQGLDNGASSGTLDLALGNIAMPTAYAVRAGEKRAARGGDTHVTNHNTINITDLRAANQVGVVLERTAFGTGKSMQRALGLR